MWEWSLTSALRATVAVISSGWMTKAEAFVITTRLVLTIVAEAFRLGRRFPKAFAEMIEAEVGVAVVIETANYDPDTAEGVWFDVEEFADELLNAANGGTTNQRLSRLAGALSFYAGRFYGGKEEIVSRVEYIPWVTAKALGLESVELTWPQVGRLLNAAAALGHSVRRKN